MKVGDLVKHRTHSKPYLVFAVDKSGETTMDAPMIGIISDGERKYMHRNWLEVISEYGGKNNNKRKDNDNE